MKVYGCKPLIIYTIVKTPGVWGQSPRVQIGLLY